MAILVDTSILGRLANRADSSHSIAKRAVAEYHRRGEILSVCPQNLIEFRNFATRPLTVNGLGLSATEAEGLLAVFESTFALLPETPDIYPAWKAVVSALDVLGKQVHDARLVAICHVHAMSHLMTFNVSHFARMSGLGPGIALIDPVTI